MSKITLKYIFITLLSVFISLPPFTFQILPSFSSDVKNKKISYKEIRKRKHSKNKPNLKNQTAPNCPIVTVKTETLPSTKTYQVVAVANPTNGKAYIFGGAGPGSSIDFINNITEYDPSTGAVTSKTTLPNARAQGSAVWNASNNKAYIIGGRQISSAFLNEILEYDPATDMVTTKSATLPTARRTTASVWNPVNNKIYIFGGFDSGSMTLDQILEYDPVGDTLTTKSQVLPTVRQQLVATWSPLNNKAYIIGGTLDGNTGIDQIVEYDPSTGAVAIRSEKLPNASGALSSFWDPITKKIFIIGLRWIGPTSVNYICEFDPIAGGITTRLEKLPSVLYAGAAVWSTATNKAYCFGGADYSNRITEYDPCGGPSNPVISSVTINGVTQPISSSYTVANGQTIVVSATSVDSYYGRVTLTCNPPAGVFSSTDGIGKLEFTPGVTNVGNNYSYTVRAVNSTGAAALSDLTFSVSAICGNEAGCPSGQACFSGTCRIPCSKDPTIPIGAECTARPAPVSPLGQTPVVISTPTPTPSPTAVSISTATSTPTATPVQNITNTNSGSSASSQGTTVSSPQINTAAPSTNTQKPSVLPQALDFSNKNNPVIILPQEATPKPSTIPTPPSIDFSLLKNNPPKVKPDSAPYIDFSKDGLVKPGK